MSGMFLGQCSRPIMYKNTYYAKLKTLKRTNLKSSKMGLGQITKHWVDLENSYVNKMSKFGKFGKMSKFW